MQIGFDDKVILVTGAARGIGRVIAEAFAEDGATVVALDLAGPDLDGLRHPDSPVTPIACDVTSASEVEAAVASVTERFGRIDVLVNNAGINAEGLISDIDERVWQRCFDVNVGGTLRLCQAVLPTMKAQSSGRIINAASFAAIVPSVGAGIYAASKAAVVQLTRTLAGEVGPWGITANSYAPGMIPTAINGFADMPPEAQGRLLDTLSLRQWGEASQVADLVRFLASDAAAYITGTLVDVSGGKLATQRPSVAYEGAGDGVDGA